MEQQNDEAPCYASVCARLETATPGTSDGNVNFVHAVYQDVAAVASGLHISIIDVRIGSLHAHRVKILLPCEPVILRCRSLHRSCFALYCGRSSGGGTWLNWVD